MTAKVVPGMWSWRTFVWAGVIGSLVSWALVWYMGRGVTALMVLVAVASVAFAYRGTRGMRLALVGLMVAGLVMFLASLYWMAQLMLMGAGQVTAQDVLTTTVFPMVSAIVLLVGSVSGFRHVAVP